MTTTAAAARLIASGLRRRPALAALASATVVPVVGAFLVSGTAAAGAATPPPDLGTNQRLTVGHSLSMGSYILQMKRNGDLVASGGGYVFWHTGTAGHDGAYAVMQGDGNFVVYSPQNVPLWDTGAAAGADCLLGQSQGRMVVDTPGDQWGWWPLWSLSPCYQGTGPRLAVVGDSITWEASYAFPQVLAPHYSYDVSSMPGYQMASQVPAERAMIDNPAGKAQDVIINLGTNDADQDNTNWQWGLAGLLQGAGDRCTVLVTVSVRADADSGVPGDNIASDINAAERQWAEQHHNFHILPWAELLRENGYQWTGPDGIHLNQSGVQELSQLYLQYLQRDCGS